MGVGLLGLALSTGTAAAQVAGCGFSDCTPQGGEVMPTTEVTTGGPGSGTQALPQNVDAPTSRTVAAPAAAEAPAGTLPVTGGDVVGIVLLGGLAVGTGALLVRSGRRERTAA